MLAITYDGRDAGLTLSEVPEPVPLRDEALVAVRAVSVNRGDLTDLADARAGDRIGWDVAGTVVRAAAGGTGPPVGARVIGLSARSEGWAERVAIPTAVLAELPAGVTFEQGSTLPVAGLTAIGALGRIGLVLGRRVLVTGAAGGVGRIAMQLARAAGAHVTALVRRPEQAVGLRAHDVVTSLEPDAPAYDGVVDAVGGPVLGLAVQRLAPGATAVTFAGVGQEPTSFPSMAVVGAASGAEIHGLYLPYELTHGQDGAADLARLGGLVADGRLDPAPGLVVGWEQAGHAAAEVLGGRVAGKAVLTVG